MIIFQCPEQQACEDTNFTCEPEIYFDCPPNFNVKMEQRCTGYGQPFYPVDQNAENVPVNYPNASCAMTEQGAIVCQDCVNVQQIGYSCILNEFIEG